MKPETRARYLSIARHHIEKAGINPEVDKRGMQKYLRELAGETTPAYWRRLKTAIAVFAEDNWGGRWPDEYRSMKNPMTGGKKGKRVALPESCHSRKRCRKVTTSQMQRLRENTSGRMRAAIEVIAATGCRPAEVETMRVLPDGKVFIHGAKRDERGGGHRGADRVLEVDQETAEALRGWLAEIPHGSMENIRKQVSRKARTLFPKSNHPPTLKSLRHQFGSELKARIAAGELTRVEAAYMMGHQSTKSLAVYGNSKSATGRSKVRPDQNRVKMAEISIRDNYRGFEAPTDPPPDNDLKKSRKVDYGRGL